MKKAMKDWKKVNLYDGEVVWQKDYGRKIGIYRTEDDKIDKWFIFASSPKIIMYFKTKAQALKYARKYMKKH